MGIKGGSIGHTVEVLPLPMGTTLSIKRAGARLPPHQKLRRDGKKKRGDILDRMVCFFTFQTFN